MSKKLDISIGLIGVSALVVAAFYQIKRFQTKNLIAGGKVKLNEKDEATNDNVPDGKSPLDINRIGQKVSIADNGDVVNGYTYPTDMNKLTFPVQVLTKPNMTIADRSPRSLFPIDKSGNIEKPISIKKYDGSIYNVTYNELVEKTLIL